jgi:hypothetical protein
MESLYRKLAKTRTELTGREHVAVVTTHGLSVMSMRLAMATGAEVI